MHNTGHSATNTTSDNILVVDDDSDINGLLCDLLGQKGYNPTPAFSGTEALLLLSQKQYALVVLDLMLPGLTGEEVLVQTRRTSTVPIIVLTARTDKQTTVELLRMGADDYLGKPFDNEELLARVEVQLRRDGTPGARVTYKDIVLDMDIFDARIGHEPVGLSKREYEILRLLMSRPSKVFTKNNLYETVWGAEFLSDDNTINVHISRIRAKLARLSDTEYIETVWGIGFKMKP